MLPVLLFLIAAIIVTWPMAITADAYDHVDTLFNTWLMSWNCHSLTNLQNPLYIPIFAGQDDAVGRNYLLLTQSVSALPLFLLHTNPVRTHNILFVISLAFAGFAVFLLAITSGLNRNGAIFAGIAFISLPFFQGHLWHLQLMSMGLGIMVIRQGLRYLREESTGWTISLFLFLQGLASLYYWYFINLALLLMIIWSLFKRKGRRVTGLIIWSAAGNLMILPFLVHHMMNAGSWNMDVIASTDIATFLSPWHTSLLTGWMRPSFIISEAAFWPGIAVVTGVLWWLFENKARKNTHIRDASFMMILFVFFILFSLGPTLVVWNHQISRAPLRFLSWMPGLSSIRIPARAGFLFLLPVIFVAGKVLQRKNWLIMLAIILSLVEVFPGKLPMFETRPDPWHYWIGKQQPGTVAFLPVSYDMIRPEMECMRLYGSILHFTPTINGYGSSLPINYVETADILNTWPSDEADSLLSKLGVKCLVIADTLVSDADTVWIKGPKVVSGILIN